MSTDYGEKERQFLETLKTDTGRDVAEWMAIIAAEKLTTRNEIIDWLRRKGFMFSKASWLERIHNNGGRPIYENGGAARKTARPRRAAAPTIAPAAAPARPLLHRLLLPLRRSTAAVCSGGSTALPSGAVCNNDPAARGSSCSASSSWVGSACSLWLWVGSACSLWLWVGSASRRRRAAARASS